jgi:aldehyde dehydrogenase (NAD+)
VYESILRKLGISERHSGACDGSWIEPAGGTELASIDPSTGCEIARVVQASAADYDRVVDRAVAAFQRWRLVPAPARGEIVRRLGLAFREHKTDLARLLSLEVGKIRSEAEGEIQEMIDMCDFAVGLSRQLHGPTMASERPRHRMFEQWQPLGPVGIITAFNFPAAVWAWNAAVAAVCGDTTVWKPSPEAPLVAIAIERIVNQVVSPLGHDGVFGIAIGTVDEVGERMLADPRIPLVSATGSCRMGRRVGQVVGGRLGRTILELGGNNALIVTPSANLDLALRAVLFAAVGTAGQRCTSLRRLIVHESIAEGFIKGLQTAYRSVRVGDPWEESTLLGPLISERAVAAMTNALEVARREGGEVLCGGCRLGRPGYFVEPAIVRARPEMAIVREETFAPILYAMTYRHLDEALLIQNGVEQGLTSAIVTDNLRESERFLSADGSDCGIANVNMGTSGAEIGGAFGGEKSSGGGREAGSDAWKAYMRRQTCTINGGGELPLAQGVRFEVI